MTTTAPRPDAPPRRGRRSGRKGGSRLLNAAVGLVLLGAAVGVQSLDLTHNEYRAPLTYVGAKGENIDAKRFTVRLNSLAAAKSIQHLSNTIKTDHLFLVADISAKSRLKPYKLGAATLLTADGKRFATTDRIDNSATVTNKWVQPEIWAGGRYFFEVPTTALAGARLIVGLPSKALVEPYSPEVEIDLALDEAAARKLAGSAQDVYSTAEK